MKRSRLRAIPSVDKVLQGLGDTGLPRAMVLHVVRRQLETLRRRKLAVPEFGVVLKDAEAALRSLRASRIQPIINGTGVLVHTNLGRAPLGLSVVDRLATIAANYNNLEYGLAEGARGGRASRAGAWQDAEVIQAVRAASLS